MDTKFPPLEMPTVLGGLGRSRRKSAEGRLAVLGPPGAPRIAAAPAVLVRLAALPFGLVAVLAATAVRTQVLHASTRSSLAGLRLAALLVMFVSVFRAAHGHSPFPGYGCARILTINGCNS